MKIRYLVTSRGDIFVTSQHKKLTSQYKDLTSQHKYDTIEKNPLQ